MAQVTNHHIVKIIEQCQVAPPRNSVPSTTLPLTYFDIPYIYARPATRIFFFEFPYSTQHFLHEALPLLKHSLSLTLQHFFPFVANAIDPPHPHIIPYIRYLSGDSLTLTVAESEANFELLISDSPQDVRDWHPLEPSLPSQTVEEDGTRVLPLMAIQVTVLPNSGFSICLAFNHLVADGKAFQHFFKFWASVCKARGDLASIEGSLPLPCHDRDKVKDPKGISLINLQEARGLASEMKELAPLMQGVKDNKEHVTLVLTRDQVEKLKKWVSIKCSTSFGSETLHISTFVVTCSLIWFCMVKSEESKGNNNSDLKESDELCHLIFPADCRDRPQISLPPTYFGNCLDNGVVAIKRSMLVGENGIIMAANAIEREVRDLKSNPLKRVETFMSYYRQVVKPGKSLFVIARSPKLAVYDTDFGWGRPKKADAIYTGSSRPISLSDCRDKEAGGIEVGIGLERTQMKDFINIFKEQLSNITI